MTTVKDMPNFLRERASEYWQAAEQQDNRHVANYLAGHWTALNFAADDLEAALVVEHVGKPLDAVPPEDWARVREIRDGAVMTDQREAALTNVLAAFSTDEEEAE